MNGYKKPPLGVMPKYLWVILVRKQRLSELMNAISRYHSEGKDVPKEWFIEARQLEKWLKRKEFITELKSKYLKWLRRCLSTWISK